MQLLQEKKIKIQDKEYPLKMTIRAMIEFENLAGHSVDELSGLKDVTILFYCTIKAGGATLSYEQFMDLIDEEPEALSLFSQIMLEPSKKKEIQSE